MTEGLSVRSDPPSDSNNPAYTRIQAEVEK
jgi:hypothetical protein